MLELKPNPIVGPSLARVALESSQPRRLLLALVLLLVALAAVLIRDRQFWFGPEETVDSDVSEPQLAHPATAKSTPSSTNQTPSMPAPAKTQAAAAKGSAESSADSGMVATSRAALPPLDLEVVADDSHRALHPGSNAASLAIANPVSPAPNAGAQESIASLSAATNAAERERVSTTAAAQPILGSPDTSYPLLAQHMSVQGQVVLQALIGVDGVIQNLRVLSGPAILASAAQQAVRQWRFKPYLENGQPVETKAKITVNFTIKVSDNSPATS